jgi:hypothetical protein
LDGRDQTQHAYTQSGNCYARQKSAAATGNGSATKVMIIARVGTVSIVQ